MNIKLAHVKITNVLGIEMLEFDAGRWNSISGPNGSGKTSVLRAIEGAVGGGNRAELIRQGADSGEAVFTFDNGYELTAKFGRDGTKRKIRTPENATINGTAGWLESKLNPLSFSPIRFVEASEKDRVEMLLNVAKLEMTTADLVEAIGDIDLGSLQFKTPEASGKFIGDPLSVIEAASKAVYDLRTGLNRSVKDKRGHIAELERTIPNGLVKPPDVSEINKELKAITDDAAAAKKLILDTEAKELAIAKERALADEKAARAELVAKLAAIASEEKRQIETVTATARAALDALNANTNPRAGEIREQLGRAATLQNQWWVAEETRDKVKDHESAATKLEKEAEEATAALKRLEALKVKLMAVMPVESLTISDGKLLYRGIPYATTNTAAQIVVALQIAMAAAGDLKLIQLDGFERLDSAARNAVEEWVAKSDAQLFVTRVTDDKSMTVSVSPDCVGA